MDNGEFLKIRRNLLLISVLMMAIYLAEVNIGNKIAFSGINITIQNPYKIYILIWAFSAYFLFRYIQYFEKKEFHNIVDFFEENFLEILSGFIYKKLSNDSSKTPQTWSQKQVALSTKDNRLENIKVSILRVGFLKYKQRDLELNNRVFNFFIWVLTFLRCFISKKFADYGFPLILGIISTIFFIIFIFNKLDTDIKLYVNSQTAFVVSPGKMIVDINSEYEVFGKGLPVYFRNFSFPNINGECEKERKLSYNAIKFIKEKLNNATTITLSNVARTYQEGFSVSAELYIDKESLKNLLIRNGYAVEMRKTKVDWCK